jgi:pimeloyl-ACP methyl ester carboxylesterase
MSSAPDGPQILLLHPIALDGRIWDGVRPDGAVALDFPGFGTAPPLAKVTMAYLADYVLGHISRPATLVGLSLGGMVAQQVAVREPGAVASLVVACSTSASSPQVMLGRAAATRSGGMGGVLPETLERWFTPEALRAGDHPGVAYARRTLLQDDPEVVAQYWEAMAVHDVTALLPAIGVPATFVAGAADRASSAGTLRQMADAVPGAVLEVIDGPHMLPLERPAEFRAALGRHLARAAAGERR